MTVIQLTHGFVALIDLQSLALVCEFKWYAFRSRRTFYAATNQVGPDGKYRRVQMHRLIAGVRSDHIDGNGLDNRLSNLRPATVAQNARNRGQGSNNTSGYKGVSSQRGRWKAMIQSSGTPRFLGYFESAIEAARAYDTAARELHGDFASVNFPDQQPPRQDGSPLRGALNVHGLFSSRATLNHERAPRRLVEWRKEAKLTMRGLADRAGLQYVTIFHIEHGRRPTTRTMLRISDSLGIFPWEVIEFREAQEW